MSSTINASLRKFLKTGALVGGGLIVGFSGPQSDSCGYVAKGAVS